jgi:hypothetical protein
MVAGQNIRSSIFRIKEGTDDYVGGAVITGSVVYENVLTRFESEPEDQIFAAQGLETLRTYRATIVPGTLHIKERDELEITHPFDHPYYGKRFRVTSMQYSTHNPRDPRNYILLNLVRSVRAHTNQ